VYCVLVTVRLYGTTTVPVLRTYYHIVWCVIIWFLRIQYRTGTAVVCYYSTIYVQYSCTTGTESEIYTSSSSIEYR
jgi:hypothetical protein